MRSQRPYGCWVGTTIRAEWDGRVPGLEAWRRAAAAVSLPALERLEHDVLSGAASLYATSAASRTAVAAAAGRDEADVRVLPIPIDSERFAPAEDATWSAKLAEPILAFVGRPDDPRKNTAFLLDAFDELRQRFATARLRIVGGSLPRAAPPGVDVVGRVPDVAVELRRAAIFVLPSRQEGFCIAAAEALASGLPVISTPCGGPEEMLRVSGGGIVASFDAADFANAVARVSTDLDRAAAMRAAGRAYVEEVHAPSRFRTLVGAALAELDD